MFWKRKRLYCLKFSIPRNNIQKDVYEHVSQKEGELFGDVYHEHIIARSKEKALKKSQMLKEGKYAFISIREMIIE